MFYKITMADKKPERVAIFIDGSNFYHSVKETFSIYDTDSVDFAALIQNLRMDRLLVGTFYYNAPLDRGYNPEIYRKQQKFFDELRLIPEFHIVLCKMRKIKLDNGKYEFKVKGDDIHLAVDMVSMAYENRYDTAILVSGDGDFVPAIKKVQKLGKHVENAYFSVSRANVLKKTCNRSIFLDKIISKKCMKSKDKPSVT